MDGAIVKMKRHIKSFWVCHCSLVLRDEKDWCIGIILEFVVSFALDVNFWIFLKLNVHRNLKFWPQNCVFRSTVSISAEECFEIFSSNNNYNQINLLFCLKLHLIHLQVWIVGIFLKILYATSTMVSWQPLWQKGSINSQRTRIGLWEPLTYGGLSVSLCDEWYNRLVSGSRRFSCSLFSSFCCLFNSWLYEVDFCVWYSVMLCIFVTCLTRKLKIWGKKCVLEVVQ